MHFPLGKAGRAAQVRAVATFKFRNLKNGQATPVPPGEYTIGRAVDAYIHVEDSSISRQHARLLNSDEGFFLEDLGSANGIAVNGEFVSGRRPLQFGDMVHIGKVPFRIDPEVAGEPSASPSAGLQQVDRGYIRKETERIGAPAKSTPISYTGPDVPASRAASGALVRQSVPLPKLVQLTTTGAPRPPTGALPPASPEPAPEVVAMPEPVKPTEEAYHTETARSSWGWWIVIFLAGLGAGLFFGLYFAKVFLEMGGRLP